MKTLANDIKNKSFKNAYLLCGEEEYLKLNYKNRLIKSIAGDDTMNLGMYEGKNIDINEVIDSAETVPFFAEYRLIVMENTGLFKSGGEQLAEYMKTIPSTTIFLFVESDVDKRSKMYKAVKSAGYICEINRQTEMILQFGLQEFLITMARKSQKPICHTLLPALAPTWKSYQEKSKSLLATH